MSQNSSILSVRDYNAQFKTFILNNNVIGTTAGIIAGICIKDVILSFISDIFVPLLTLLLLRLNIDWITKYLPDGNQFDITNFIKQLITFVICLYIGFLIIKITFENLLGIKKADNKIIQQNQQLQQPQLQQPQLQQPKMHQPQLQQTQLQQPQLQQTQMQQPQLQQTQMHQPQDSPFSSTYSYF